MKNLPFSYNWNNKLNCKSFSTVRISNPDKYKLLDLYEVYLHGKKGQAAKKMGVARLQVINNFYLHQVSPGVSFIDANLPVIDFIRLVETMYKNSRINFKEQKMSFLVFQYLTPEQLKEENLE